MFLSQLARQLDAESPDWRDNTVLLLDGAKYHTSEETRVIMKKLQLPVIFSGPYAYSSAPIELMFSGLKTGQLQAANEATGKKYVYFFTNHFLRVL